MSKNKSDQNAHEEQVFNDVLRLSMASGGYKKKAALKVSGSINAGSECPDIVITRENGSIVGLEHFRIDHNIKLGRNAQSKSAELTSAMKAEREKLMPRLEADDVSPEELASIVANFVSLAKYHQSCACCDDLTRSLDARLFGEKAGHARKLSKYRNHLTELSGDDGRIELGYLIEIHSDFQGLFMHDGTRVARLDSGQCPLYAEIYDLLFKASCEVDWILIGFYPCLTDQIANAAIMDCRNNMFKESCRRQRLKRTEYLGLGKTEPFLKQSRVGESEIELCGDKVNITIENPAEGICPELLFGTAIIDAARALNLDRSGEPYTATISVQLIYELVRMRSKGIRGIVTIYDVMRLLLEIKWAVLKQEIDSFGVRYNISETPDFCL